jgi:polysaccharide export outer membrane protein
LTGGENLALRVAPDGTVSLPEIGSVSVQGLSVEELRREINERYAEAVPGVSVTPILAARAPRHLFVVGAVQRPGRFLLESPTTVLAGLSLAGGWTHGANLRQVVVLRRDENWQLVATTLDLRGASSGRGPCPANDIFLRDSDVIVVPKSSLHHAKHDWWRPLVPKSFCPPAADCESEL